MRHDNYRDRDGPFDGYVVLKTYDYSSPAHPAGVAAVAPEAEAWVPGGRYCDQPMSWSARLCGIGGTTTIGALMLAAALFTWRTVYQPVASTSQPLVVELLPLAAPPEPVREVAPGPDQVQKQEAVPVPVPDPIPVPLLRLPLPSVSTREVPEPVKIVDPGPTVPETTAPKITAVPTANRLSSNAQPNWEGLLLAHLERFRRYPARARAARQQGTVYVRFTMNRAGMVLTSAIVKKSGSFDLDQAALDTLQRAQPLPTIPDDRPDTVELTLPIEFFLQ